MIVSHRWSQKLPLRKDLTVSISRLAEKVGRKAGTLVVVLRPRYDHWFAQGYGLVRLKM